MKCPNCGYSFLSGSVCPECGVDILIFEKTLKISDVLYNKGLDLARIRDLSGSIDSLTKSIQFNKNNYYARNLLGLVYFEVGKMADALKQWVMSASLMKEGNPAVRYIEAMQMTPGLLDDGNDAINMYNSALFHIQQKSDDLAIIQLKKALEFSPGFVDAMNLLALCYLIKNEKKMASVLVEKVLELDINNPITLNYYTVLFPDKKRISLKEIREPEIPGAQSFVPGKILDEVRRKRMFTSNFFMVQALSFMVGVLCTLALLFLTYIPGTVADSNREINSLTASLTATEDELSRVLRESERNIDRLERELTAARREIRRLDEMIGAGDQEQRVGMARDRMHAGNFYEAARIIERVDPFDLSDSAFASYLEIRDNSFRAASQDRYNDGIFYFTNDNLAAALVAFEASLHFMPDNSPFEHDVVFFLGRIAHIEGDYELARELYTRVVEEFPQSGRIPEANMRLAELPG